MRKSNKALLGVIALCAIAQGALHSGFIYPFWSKNYSAKAVQVEGLSPDQIFLSLFGFREFLSGMLWVRADSFFDQGNYDAVLPLIRLCTILDPKQIDVYSVGMWHIGYNFTDEEQRSDRRYIPAALALGKEGSTQNDRTYELFFETGWLWYHKIDDDYDKAVWWFEEARKRPDILPARRNLLNVAYQRNGQVQEALDLFYDLYERADVTFREEPLHGNRQNLETIERNLDNHIVRMMQRGWIAQNTEEGKRNRWYETTSYDTKPPFDVKFSAKVTVLESRVLRVEGTWGVLPVGTRIRIVLRDADHPLVSGKLAEMNWDGLDTVDLDPARDLTFMQDQLFVRNQRFNRRIDMSKDLTMYPIKGEKYIVEFYYNPRSAAPHMQDKFGWNGEGLTDSNFLRQDVRPGQRVIYTSVELTKDQILRRNDWESQTPVVKTQGFRDAGTRSSTDDVIIVPSLRGGAQPNTQPKQ